MPGAPASNRSKSSTTSLLGVLGIICLFLIIALYVSWPKIRPILVPQELSVSTQEGAYAKAVEVTQSVLSDPNASVEQKALAVSSYVGARYRVSGNVNDLLLDIQDLKQIVLNPVVTAKTRADSLAWLAGMYNNFGRNPMLFTETFKGDPFASYLVEGNPDLSARRLFEWSYSINPSSYAAINIAWWYAAQAGFNPKLDTATRDSNTSLAAEYLRLADTLSNQETINNPNFVNNARYQTFRSYRSLVVDALALQNVEPYNTTYRDEFNAYVTFAQSGNHILSTGLLLNARLVHAGVLLRDKDTTGVTEQLDLIAEGMKDVQNPAVSNFVLMLGNERKSGSTTGRSGIIAEMYQYSPAFKAAVEAAVAAN